MLKRTSLMQLGTLYLYLHTHTHIYTMYNFNFSIILTLQENISDIDS